MLYPHFGHIKISVAIKAMKLNSGKLEINERVKFYFWVNVAGICSMATGTKEMIESSGLNDYDFIHINPPGKNGFKLMNCEQQILDLILPDLDKYSQQEEKSNSIQ